MPSKLKIMMTSIGSLVGSNFLACLDSRRDQVCVIGVNSDADAPNNFVCDTVHLSPETAEIESYLEFLSRIVRDEQPDLVLPGRDEDIYALALLRERDASCRDRLAVGSPHIASIMLDKYATFEFAQQNDLPFARTISTDYSTKKDDAERLLQQADFPLVAKPRRGFGSLGVFFIIDKTQLAKALEKPNYVIQEYLGDRADVYDHADQLEAGIPLFFQIPDDKHFTGQAQISPSGGRSEIFTTRNVNVMGRAVRIEPVDNRAFNEIAEYYAECFAKHGWRGSFNIQCRPRQNDKDFVAFEVNGRMIGSSSARLTCGFDEVGMLVKDFCSPKALRDVTVRKVPDFVVKTLSEYPVYGEYVRCLKKEGVWNRSSSVAPS